MKLGKRDIIKTQSSTISLKKKKNKRTQTKPTWLHQELSDKLKNKKNSIKTGNRDTQLKQHIAQR